MGGGFLRRRILRGSERKMEVSVGPLGGGEKKVKSENPENWKVETGKSVKRR